MPAAAPFINAFLIRAYFDYDPATGRIVHKPTPVAQRATGVPIIRRTSNFQYRYEGYARSDHRLIWAMHHPENPNPKYIIFLDGDKTNTRIENLMGTDQHPRWIGHTKQNTESVRQLPDGSFVHTKDYDAALKRYQFSQASEAEERKRAFWESMRERRAAKADRAPIAQEDLDFFENMAKVSPEEEERRRLVEQLKNEDWD